MRALIILAGLAAVAAVAGPAQAQTGPGVATVYSSLPLSGASRPQAQAIVRGARLALEEAGGGAGGVAVRYVSLNDASRRAGAWTPERTSANARRAAQDPTAIAYIGEFNSGASAISIPILDEADFPQISPTNTAVGLTRGGVGADEGEPEKYYPAARRAFFRIAPNDRVQGAALAGAMRERGCRRIAVLHDGEIYGAGLGALLRRAARRIGLRVAFTGRISPKAPNYRALAAGVRARRAACVAFTGITANGAVQLFRDLARALPRTQLFAGDGVAESGFTDPREGGLPPRVGRRVVVTINTLAPDALPESGRLMLARFEERYGAPADPYAVNGFEAMRLVLDAVAVVGPEPRAVTRWVRAVRGRSSVLGRYSFDRFGDTTLRRFGTYRIERGALVWAGPVQAP